MGQTSSARKRCSVWGNNLNAHPNNSSAHRGNRRGDHKANP